MAAGKTTYFSTAVLNWLRGTTFPALAGSAYVGLFTVAPSDAGGGTEVTGNGYARQAITFAAPSGATPTSMASNADVLFPLQTPGGYGTVVAFGIFDLVSGGNLIYWNTCTNVTYALNDQAKLASGSVTLTED